MPCVHLRELYAVCQSHDLKLSSGDLIRIVCPQCGVTETCPSVHAQEYDAKAGTVAKAGAMATPVNQHAMGQKASQEAANREGGPDK